MSSETIRGETVLLDDFQVVAVRGEGIWVTDSGGNAWHLGGPHEDASTSHKLARTYRNAFDE